MKITISFACVLLLLSGCSSVNIRTDGEKETTRPPDFEQTFNYWWWGLKGEHEVNVREVCLGKPVEQMQAVDTLSDSLFGLITLGIYSPRSARVWCKEKEA